MKIYCRHCNVYIGMDDEYTVGDPYIFTCTSCGKHSEEKTTMEALIDIIYCSRSCYACGSPDVYVHRYDPVTVRCNSCSSWIRYNSSSNPKVGEFEL
ncbi:hypothetical protein EBU99_13995 [bacterium]|nr:hypothetical protein [bacterium]